MMTAAVMALVASRADASWPEVIVAARQAELPVAVVSNNSAKAITAYLTAHRLAGHVSPVVGRPYAGPARMKPNPEPILQAVKSLRSEPELLPSKR